MTAVTFSSCGPNDALWDEYFLLLMEHYPELTLPYDFPEAFSFIGDPIVQGDALLIRDADGRTLGALGFVFPGETPSSARTCQVESLYLSPVARQPTTLYRLLQAFSAYMAQRVPQVEIIQFWSPADREDLRRLFMKCSRLVKTNEKDFGRIDLFECHPAQLAEYASRWRDRGSSPLRKGADEA